MAEKKKEVSAEHYRLLVKRMCVDRYILNCREVAQMAANEAVSEADLDIYREYDALADNAEKEREKLEAELEKYGKSTG